MSKSEITVMSQLTQDNLVKATVENKAMLKEHEEYLIASNGYFLTAIWNGLFFSFGDELDFLTITNKDCRLKYSQIDSFCHLLYIEG